MLSPVSNRSYASASAVSTVVSTVVSYQQCICVFVKSDGSRCTNTHNDKIYLKDTYYENVCMEHINAEIKYKENQYKRCIYVDPTHSFECENEMYNIKKLKNTDYKGLCLDHYMYLSQFG